MDLELKGKVALVTGGSQGIGKAIARELAMEGADVAVCARTRQELEATARELAQETGCRILPVVADVADAQAVQRMVDITIEDLGRLDILVNNAGRPGGFATGPLEAVTDEAMHEDLNTKFMGCLRCARAVAPHMARQGWGRIINVAGQSARSSGSYGTGIRNIAMVHLSKTLSDELGPSGITVNVVHPGTARTPWLDQMLADPGRRHGITAEEMEARMAGSAAIRRIVESREVAYLVVFLASPKAACITGEAIAASGGANHAVFS